MRSRSFICILVLAQSAFTGVPHHTRQQATLTASIDLARLPKEIRARVEELQARNNGASNPLVAFPLKDRSPLSPTLRDPQAIMEAAFPQRLEAEPVPHIAPNAQQAPFDTVYVESPTITHRHLYEHDADGRIVSEVIQYESMGRWLDEEKITCTFNATGLRTSRVRESSPLHTVIEREVCTYDNEATQTSDMYEAMSANTCRLELVYRDTSSYSTDGSGLMSFSQHESWEDGIQTRGYRTMSHPTDSGAVLEFLVWNDNEWVGSLRLTQFHSPSPGAPSCVIELWSEGTWKYDSRDTYFNGGPDWDKGIMLREMWLGDTWVPGSLTTYSESEDSLTETILTQQWTMDHWIPASRHISVHDSEGQLISWLSQDWVDGWVTSSNGTQTFMPDGSIRREYRSYSNGSTPITYVAIEAYDAADRWTLHETQTWWDDVLGYNDRLTRSFNASGREQEIVHSFGQGGEWYWIDRDSAAYDERNRLTTIGHSSWNEPGWMPFSDMSVPQEYSWETADEAGNAYKFEDYQTIRFAYRDAATSVEPIVATLPATTELTQNYPNPFNPSTTIRFSVAQPAPTTLRIYDLLGREVAQLVNERKEPGNYEVRFDASGLASGMYISQFTSGTVTQTKKMILMR